ncbi:ABC transporter ATP-binding protein [Rhodococcus sp. ARC_M12]|uniref:ABC transporter ATP-binding protein n=1 Tax=Rhodococcus sp. ARC_M12 TaxID=2928854 RepID=UPI001FB30597|nr:ABC transporter ATP-binding protein [Rhodococcus sp. ARC_M12]MCJ0979647.1 ABC transporter ATP-binding protein [Rhodococcus sp. ARC_M12]
MNNLPTPAVAVRGLCKTYSGAPGPVLENVDFTIDERELVCIVGHSGTGKSTLLRAVAGLTSASGEVSINGRTVDGPPADLAVVFQDYGRSLLPWMRVRENVELPLRRTTGKAERRRRAESALESVGLAGRGDYYPWEMSGGMQQRAAIARALAFEPRVLLMDEPFASVDAQTRADLEDLTMKVQREFGMTVIIVTHDVDEAVYMSNKVIVLGGSPASVTATVPVPLPDARDQLSTKSSGLFGSLRMDVLRRIRPDLADPAVSVA